MVRQYGNQFLGSERRGSRDIAMYSKIQSNFYYYVSFNNIQSNTCLFLVILKSLLFYYHDEFVFFKMIYDIVTILNINMLGEVCEDNAKIH